ncbi:uncharacterized protein LOC142143227 [Mixophyes fleayi]|uniref:uncharacterized protein LOC142143227 n=1 Tax=Mixophyes fleayi TaxID=3061075 RepID=UPI003F4E16BA
MASATPAPASTPAPAPGKKGGKTTAPKPPPVAGTSASTAPATAGQGQPSQDTPQKTPTLEPWMRQTVVLKLKEVEGRVPDMTAKTFGKKMILDQGFSKAETLSMQNYLKGIWYITFDSIAICKRYWEAVKTARPESPFSRFVGNCPIQREERRVTVSMRNPHTPGKDIATFLSRFCSVVKDPSKILDVNGFWTGKWSIIIRLRKDSTATDGLQHLPSSFALGGSAGLLHYADQPRNCRKCGEADHMARSCKVSACRNCKVAGHESKDCPRKLSCNLCGLASHIYRDCPQRARSYAAAAGIGLPESGPAPALQPKPAQRKAPPPIVDQDQIEYQVKQILDSRKIRGSVQFLVDWKGYGPEERFWDP